MKRAESWGLYQRLTTEVRLVVPGFEGVARAEDVRQQSFAALDPSTWQEEFKFRIENAKGYLPVYRMSDGEFIFVCGWKPYPAKFLRRYPRMTLRSWAKAVLRRRTDLFISGTNSNSFEIYNKQEWSQVRADYATRVQRVAEEGILAINFVSHVHFPQQYLKPMCRWMDENGIRLTPTNYFPFYFVYAHFLGPGATTAYRGRRILIVTSDVDGTKAPSIRRTLLRLGAEAVTFIPISPSKSMFDRIDISKVGPVDLVLIGAGVGAINILEQVRPLGATSIDAGFVLDCLWKPETFVGKRAFTLPDAGSPLLG